MRPDDTTLEGTRPLPQRAAVFHFIHFVLTTLIPKSFLMLLDRLLFRITPQIPVCLVSQHDLSATRIFLHSYVITVVFCLVGSELGTLLAGTLVGDMPKFVYFSLDWQNMVNYAVICPAYVGCIITLIYCSLKLRKNNVLKKVASNIHGASPRYGNLKISEMAVLVLAVSVVSTTNFVSEFLNPNIYPSLYWFMQPESTTTNRILGPIGAFYIIMNFTLLVLCVLAIFFFLDFVAVGRQIGHSLKTTDGSATSITFQKLREHLQPFTDAYLCSKAIVMLLIANVYTWAGMELKGSLNLAVLVIVLAIAGLVIVPFPRYYVQLGWYEFSKKRYQANPQLAVNYEDLRSARVQGAARLIDWSICAGVAKASLSWVRDAFF